MGVEGSATDQEIIAAVQDAGDDMLPGVQLHPQKAGCPVNLAGDGLPHGQGGIAQMDDFRAVLPGMEHMGGIQRAGVGDLAAALGVEAGGIQDDFIALVRLPAGGDHSLEGGLVGILVIYFSCWHIKEILSR